jgi:hypothetical protein
MTRGRNLLPLAGFLLCAIALVSYPTFFAGFEATRDVAWASWLLFALGLGLVGAGLLRAFRSPGCHRGRVIASILGLASLATVVQFVFMTEIWSRQLPASARAPKVGEKAPDFTLPDAEGRLVRLSELLGSRAGASESAAPGSWVLLIFYRGYW